MTNIQPKTIYEIVIMDRGNNTAIITIGPKFDTKDAAIEYLRTCPRLVQESCYRLRETTVKYI